MMVVIRVSLFLFVAGDCSQAGLRVRVPSLPDLRLVGALQQAVLTRGLSRSSAASAIILLCRIERAI